MNAASQTADTARLERLLDFVSHDPGNQTLLRDAAETALACHRPDTALILLENAGSAPDLMNLRGLAQIDLGHFEEAAVTFQSLLAAGPPDPALKFNLAWCQAMLGNFDAAASLIDDEVMASSERAASLLIEALHHLGRLDEALERGEPLAAANPGDQRLMGALALAALDAGRSDLARAYSSRAGDSVDGLTVRGMILAEDGNTTDARALFQHVLAAAPGNARANLGLGLSLMNQGQYASAARSLDQAATAFGAHLGTWVAAGWAYFAAGDLAASRARFETALKLDDTFAETHGGLAVLDVAEGEVASGRRRMEVARRLDRHSFSAALAQMLLLQAEGNEKGAERIRQLAFDTQLSEGGPTLGQAVLRLASGRR